MDILIVSSNEKILHISNQEDKIDYTIYDNHCRSIGGGVIDLECSIDNKDAIKNVLDIVQNQPEFSEPYIYLSEEMTEDLLELIQEADYKSMQEKIQIASNYNSCEKEEIELEMVN